MKTLNRVYLIGSAGRDPEVKMSANGSGVVHLSLATNERFKDKQGQWQDSTEWHALVAFGRTAEVVRDYVKKGSPVHVEGRLQTRAWEKDGQKHYRTEIVVESLILLGGGAAKKETRPPEWSEVGGNAADDPDIPF